MKGWKDWGYIIAGDPESLLERTAALMERCRQGTHLLRIQTQLHITFCFYM